MRHATQLPKTQYRRLRTTVLATAAVMAGLRGLAYIPSVYGERSAASLTFIETWLPLQVWGWVWITGLVFLLASIFVPRLAIPSMSVFVGMHVLWGDFVCHELGVPRLAAIMDYWLVDHRYCDLRCGADDPDGTPPRCRP